MGNTASAVGKAFGYGSREAQTATDQSVDFQRAAAGVKICGHVWTRQRYDCISCGYLEIRIRGKEELHLYTFFVRV